MNSQIVSFSVAVGAPPVNIAPAGFNPAPADGFIAVLGVSDPVTGQVGLASLELKVGLNETPLATSPIPVNDSNAAGVGPSSRNLRVAPTAVRGASNVQLNVSGTQTGATATGRLQLFFAPAAELPILEAALRG